MIRLTSSVCLLSYALLQHLPSYLGFSYLGHGVSLHGCSSKAQRLLLTLDEGYFLTATLPDLQRGKAPLALPEPVQPPLLGRGLIFPAPGLGQGVAPPSHRSWPWMRCGPSWLPTLASDAGWLLQTVAPDLGRGVAPLGRSCAVAAWHSGPLPLTSDAGQLLSAALRAGHRSRLH